MAADSTSSAEGGGADTTASSAIGNATTTGDVARTTEGGAAADGSPFDAGAILAGCFDAPDTSLSELLSGKFGTVN
jgi:hypothetical protein